MAENLGVSEDKDPIPKLSERDQELKKISMDTEFLNSFVRIDNGDEVTGNEKNGKQSEGDRTSPPSSGSPLTSKSQEKNGKPKVEFSPTGEKIVMGKTSFSQLTKDMKLKKGGKRGRGQKQRQRMQEEVYTDKDRAAAVVMGSRDIKQSLKMKHKQDRSKALQIPEEAEPGNLLALGNREMKSGDVNIAISFVHKALELNPNDKNALVARSKCYLLLGDTKLALKDAEAALEGDKTFVGGIYQKAEALYHLGDFEHSLMYYHRGLRLRPEMNGFRLGIQKAREAIENTIGGKNVPALLQPPDKNENGMKKEKRSRPSTGSDRQRSRNLLGELCVDKEYLEQLLKNPDIKGLHGKEGANDIISQAEEAVAFLNTRQEFWRQRRPNTAGVRRIKRRSESRSTT